MATTNIANLNVKLTAGTASFEAGMNSARKHLQGVNAATREVKTGMHALSGISSALGGVVPGLGQVENAFRGIAATAKLAYSSMGLVGAVGIGGFGLLAGAIGLAASALNDFFEEQKRLNKESQDFIKFLKEIDVLLNPPADQGPKAKAIEAKIAEARSKAIEMREAPITTTFWEDVSGMQSFNPLTFGQVAEESKRRLMEDKRAFNALRRGEYEQTVRRLEAEKLIAAQQHETKSALEAMIPEVNKLIDLENEAADKAMKLQLVIAAGKEREAAAQDHLLAARRAQVAQLDRESGEFTANNRRAQEAEQKAEAERSNRLQSVIAAGKEREAETQDRLLAERRADVAALDRESAEFAGNNRRDWEEGQKRLGTRASNFASVAKGVSVKTLQGYGGDTATAKLTDIVTKLAASNDYLKRLLDAGGLN